MKRTKSDVEILADMEHQFAPTPVRMSVVKPAGPLLDDGNGGFPPIDDHEPTYGGRRPGRSGPRDIPTWLALLLIWTAVGSAWLIDSPEQRAADQTFMLIVGIGGSTGLFWVDWMRRR